MAKDKKGKGSGSKDACYHKVKSRYSVWPSAYASGALVKCRKVGAANWGNKSESFEVQDGVVEGAMPEPIDPKKHKDAQKKQKMRNLAINNENPNEKKVAEKKAGGPKLMGEGKYSKSETYVKGTAPVRATYGGKTESFPKETYKKKSKKVEVSEGDKYDNVGKQAARMSLLNNPGPRSTPEQTAEKKARLEKKRGMKLDDHPQFKKEEVDKRRAPAELISRLSAKREGHMAQDGPNKAAYDAKQRILKKTKDKMTEEIVRSILDEAGKKCWKGYKKAGTQKLFGKTYNRCVKANEELSIDQQMKISRDYNRMSPEEKKKANQKAVAGIPKGKPKKDTRTDAQKMVDAAYGKRPTNPKGSLGT